jgi:hypothetical protein
MEHARCMGKMKMHIKFSRGNIKGRDHIGNEGVAERIISSKWCVKVSSFRYSPTAMNVQVPKINFLTG